jgi:hypothetical protein
LRVVAVGFTGLNKPPAFVGNYGLASQPSSKTPAQQADGHR